MASDMGFPSHVQWPTSFSMRTFSSKSNMELQSSSVSSPVSSISTPSVSQTLSATFLGDYSNRFFARIGPSLGGGSPATKKVEQFSVHRVTGDGRCLFEHWSRGWLSTRVLL